MITTHEIQVRDTEGMDRATRMAHRKAGTTPMRTELRYTISGQVESIDGTTYVIDGTEVQVSAPAGLPTEGTWRQPWDGEIGPARVRAQVGSEVTLIAEQRDGVYRQTWDDHWNGEI